MNKGYFQSLLEGVKRRTSSGSIPIYHKKSPIGKFVSKQIHDEVIGSTGDYRGDYYPHYHPKIYPLISRGIDRGRIGNAKNISYRFSPRVKFDRVNKKIVHKDGTESGNHYYAFKTNGGNDVEIKINHKSKTRKDRKSRSDIMFDVDGMLSRDSPEDRSRTSTAAQVFRGLSSAVKHHIKAHNPDIIRFNARDDFSELGDYRDRSKLYSYMVKKLSRTHTTSIKQKTYNDEEGFSRVTQFILQRKKKKPRRINTNNKEN